MDKYKEGDLVAYYKNECYTKAIIKKVHYDDIEPYYTIMCNGVEVQTVKNRIIKLEME